MYSTRLPAFRLPPEMLELHHLVMSLLIHLHSVIDRGRADSKAEGRLTLRDSLAVPHADSIGACRWQWDPASAAWTFGGGSSRRASLTGSIERRSALSTDTRSSSKHWWSFSLYNYIRHTVVAMAGLSYQTYSSCFIEPKDLYQDLPSASLGPINL